MKQEWVDVGPLSDFPAGEPVLRKDEGGRRYACVRIGDEVHALDDRCPHEGYPLSQGCVRGGELTCAWHNWKFDVATGENRFGGDPVRRYPTRVEGGRVHLNRALDRGAEVRRLLASLREALARDEMPRALREALRLAALDLPLAEGSGLGRMGIAFEVLARDGAERAEYGFNHGLALLADLCSWIERGWVPAEEAFVAAAHAVAEPSLHLGPRARAPGRASGARALMAFLSSYERPEPAKIVAALEAERREEAEARVRELVEVGGAAAAREALLPFVARHIYSYGHGAIFLAKACELAARFPAVAEDVIAASVVELSWATVETSLPPWAATRAALARVVEGGLGRREVDGGVPIDRADRDAYEALVLEGERQAADATVERLARGVDPVSLLRASAHAAAVRLARFDAAWEQRLEAAVDVLDVSHAVTFAESAISLVTAAPGAPALLAAQLAVLSAAFVGKLRRGDAAAPPAEAPERHGSLLEAAEARDVGRALSIAAGLGPEERLRAYGEIAPFAAFDAAVRPIFYAHTVKTAEALRRLEAADPHADAAYLRALCAYVVPRRPELRVRRVAEVARRFLRDGRPPEGLY